MAHFDPDEPVFVVDLTPREMARCAAEMQDSEEALPERELPDPPERPIRWLALLLEGRDEPLCLPVEPTRDVQLLDALGRILRIAVLSGERMPNVAIKYGEEAERKLAFEKHLPSWAYMGIDAATARTLPDGVRAVLAPKLL